MAVVSLQKIKLAAFEEHFEAKVCYVSFVVYVNYTWCLLRIRAVQRFLVWSRLGRAGGIKGTHIGRWTGEGREEN